MAAEKSDERIKEELRAERAALADAVVELRSEIGDVTNVGGMLQSKLPLVAVGAFGLGFVKAGGVGATMRLLMRRSREGEVKAKAGRFRLVERD